MRLLLLSLVLLGGCYAKSPYEPRPRCVVDDTVYIVLSDTLKHKDTITVNGLCTLKQLR